jgi:LysM repeat protein
MMTLRSRAEAEEVKQRLISNYLPQDTSNIVYQNIVEPFEISSKYVSLDELTTPDKAYATLSAYHEQEITYRVADKDNLSRIADRFNVSISEIERMNPGVDRSTILKVGQELRLMSNLPRLSVEIIREEKRTETKPAEVVYRENPNRERSYSNVVQAGVDGEVEVTYHITTINGSVTETKPINTVTTIQSVDQIVEVGTR